MNTPPKPDRIINTGIFYGAGAYLIWGFMPLYFRPLSGLVSPILILSHRVVWSIALLLVFVTALGQWPAVARAFRNRRTLTLLILSTVMISSNWYLFVYVTTHGQVTQAALGYFLNPLVSAALGMLFLGERLRWLQWLAVAVALSGVTYLAIGIGAVPTLAILLAITFGCYGLLRKLAAVDAVAGLAVETSFLLPIALGFLYWGYTTPGVPNGQPAPTMLAYLAIGCGLFTTIPLLLFGKAARKLRLTTLGFLQYLGPTCQFLLAVVVFGEPFPRVRQIAFALVWLGVALFLLDSILHHTRRPSTLTVEEPA